MSDADIAMRATVDTSGAAGGFQKLNGMLGDFGMRTNAASASMGPLGTLLGSLASPLSLVALGVTAIGGALVSSAQAAAAWESSMVGVAKTTGLAGPALDGLSEGLLRMSTEMPVAADQLASVAAAAGSLGIGQKEADIGDFSGQAAAIEEFTAVAIKMGVGFEMSADQAATAGAKILNSFGQNMDAANMEKLGSVVNSMGDAFAATEPQVLDFLNRASFLNSTMGQTIPQVAALGTTLISTGMDSEVAATGLKSFLNMATSETSKKGGMDNWAALMGTSVDELKAKMGSDLNSTLIETANKIVAIQDPVERFQKAVALAGTEGAPALLKLAGQQDNYAKALGMTNAQWENAQSLQKTYDAQMESVNSKWTIFTNTISMAATEFGTGMLPVLGSILGFLTDITKIGVKAAKKVSDVLSPIKDAAGGLLAESYEGSGVQMAWEAAKNWAGIGTKQAEQMAEEIEKNKPLQLAGAEAIKVGVDLGLYDETGKLIAGKVFDEKVWALAAQDTMINAINAANEAAGEEYNRPEWKNNIGKALGFTSVNGVDLTYTIAANKNHSWVVVKSPNGELFRELANPTKEDAIRRIVEEHGAELGLDPIGELELQGQYLEADKLKLTAEQDIEVATEITFNRDAIAKNIAPMKDALGGEVEGIWAAAHLEGILESYVSMAGEEGHDAAVEFAEMFADGMANPNWESIGQMEEAKDAIAKAMPWKADELEQQFAQYKDLLASQVTDASLFIEDRMNELGSTATNAFSDGLLTDAEKTELLGLKPALVALQELFPAEFAKAGGESALALIAAIEAGDIPGALALIGQKSGNAFTWGVFSTKSFAELIMDPEAVKNAAVDIDKFFDGTIVPGIKGGMEAARAAFDSGQITQDQVYENLIKPLEQYGEYLPGWLEEMNAMFYSKQIDIEDYLWLLDQMTGKASDALEKTSEKIDDQTVGWDALKDTIEDCSECAISKFALWQEAQDGLFQDSYIGQGGQAYLDWKNQQISAIAETQAAMDAVGGAVLGQRYDMPQNNISIGADTSPAELAKENLLADIRSSVPSMRMDLDTSIADARFQNLYNLIQNARPVMTVEIDLAPNAAQLEAMVYNYVAAALASAT